MAEDQSSEPIAKASDSPVTDSNEEQRRMANVIEASLPERPIERRELAEALALVMSVEVRQISQFEGPMPPPAMLKDYDSVLPGLAERLTVRIEKEQSFRHEITRSQVHLENRVLTHQAVQGYLGQGLAFVIAMTAVIGGIALVNYDHQTEGLAAIITALGGLVAAFIAGKLISALAERRKNTEQDKAE